MTDRQPRRERISRAEQVGSLTGAAAFAHTIWEGIQAFWPTVGQTFSEGNSKVVLGMALVFVYSLLRDHLTKGLKGAAVSLVAIVTLGCAGAITKDGLFLTAGTDSYVSRCEAFNADGTCAEPQTEVRSSSISEAAADMVKPIFDAVRYVSLAALCWVGPGNALCESPPPDA